MAKDPAFLFYPGDYVSGTMHLDFECKGAYVDLLMLQFQKDHMSLHMIKQVLGHRFEHIWPLISDKFQENAGKLWNERLRIEKEKRIKFCNSRKENRNKAKDMSPHMSPHMENENININSIVVKDRKDSVKGREGAEYVPWFSDSLAIPANTLEAAEMNQFAQTGNRNTKFVKDMWKIFLKERLADPPIVQMQKKDIADLAGYFLNFLRPKFPKNNGQRSPKSTGQETEFDPF